VVVVVPQAVFEMTLGLSLVFNSGATQVPKQSE
jgi:hypothetical protein